MKKEIKKYPDAEAFCYDTEEAIEYNKNKDKKLVFDFNYLNSKWKIDFNLLLDQTGIIKELVSKVKKHLPMTEAEIFYTFQKKMDPEIPKRWRNNYSSQLIAGINEKSYDLITLKILFIHLIISRKYFEKTNELKIINFFITHRLITKKQELVDKEWNEIIPKFKNFRQKDIFINNKKSPIGPDLIEAQLEKLCELFNDIEQFEFINNDLITNSNDHWLNQQIVKTLYPAVIIYFFFQHIHPFPNFNGRIGRIIYDDFIRRNFKGSADFKNIFFASEAINASKDEYYNAIKQTENSQDLTYMLIYYHDIVINNLKFLAFGRNNQEPIRTLNGLKKLILRNIFTNKTPISTSEYIEKFDYDKTKQEIKNDLNKLSELNLLEYKEYKNHIRRYYIKK